MNDKVKIQVETSSDKFINYLIYHDIKYKSLLKNKTNYILIVNYEEYEKIKRRYDTKILRYYGIKYYINILNIHKYMIISFICCLFILNLLINTIFKIEIMTNDEELKEKISNILYKYDISVYKKKKSFNDLNYIKEKILEDYDNLLEWIEINEKGCKYTINLTPKVLKEIKEDNDLNDIVASKEGVIKHIVVHHGTKMKEVNEFVKKGEVLISGNIIKDDKIINTVNAKGEVYAEVWYLSKVNIPLHFKDRVNTGKIVNHYYISLFNHDFTIIGKYDSKDVMSEKKLLIDKPYLKFKLYKEKKTIYKYKDFNLTEEVAYKEGLKRSDEYIKNMLSEDEYIISKNVLKKEVNSSKMYLEVFYKVYENIGVTSKIEEKEELYESSNN